MLMFVIDTVSNKNFFPANVKNDESTFQVPLFNVFHWGDYSFYLVSEAQPETRGNVLKVQKNPF